MSFLSKIFGDRHAKFIKTLEPILLKIGSFEPSITTLSDEALKAKTAEFKDRLFKGETEDDILPEAFATVREAAKRTLGQRHFDAQLVGFPLRFNPQYFVFEDIPGDSGFWFYYNTETSPVAPEKEVPLGNYAPQIRRKRVVCRDQGLQI